MRLWNYKFVFGVGQYKKELDKCVKEIMLLEKKLSLQIATDSYKDDLIQTLQDLLEYKDNMIGQLRERIE